jgi:hypothetical protein
MQRKKRTYHPFKHLPVKKSLWALRYRAYLVLLLVCLLPIFAANNANFQQTITFLGFKVMRINPIYSLIQPFDQSITDIVKDIISQEKTTINLTGINVAELEEGLQNQLDIARKQPLDSLIPRPINPAIKAFFKYPDYNINAPVIYSKLEDFFETNADGSFKRNDKGQFIPIEEKAEDIARGNYESVPIQRLLKDGIVHIAYTVDPGEIGNSYIVGHTSNFSSVQSAYNFIFKPIERRSKVGEEFVVYDKYGRELKFKVFEVLEIGAEDTKTAYKRYEDKRVVTLQGSILDSNFQPTKRWLTRGELVLP